MPTRLSEVNLFAERRLHGPRARRRRHHDALESIRLPRTRTAGDLHVEARRDLHVEGREDRARFFDGSAVELVSPLAE